MEWALPWRRRKNLSTDQLYWLTIHLGTLLRCGVPLVSAVDTLGRGDDTALGHVCRVLTRYLHMGHSLSKSMMRLPESFPAGYYRVVETGEATGKMGTCFSRLANGLDQQNRTVRKLKNALVYPLFLLIACAAMIAVMLYFVFPMVVKVTAQAGVEPPALTRALIFVASPKILFILVPAALLALAIVVALHHPVTGPVLRRCYEEYLPPGQYFAQVRALSSLRQLALMLECGLDLVKALNYAYLVGQDSILVKEAYNDICRHVREGEMLARCFARHPVFPRYLVGMLSVSDELGDTHTTINRVADLIESNLDHKITTLTAAFEPLLMGVMGAVIGTVMLAAFLPIYSLIQL